ncbi:MAG: Hpt domain-containing protein [Faecalibacterium sp.]|nr:Hpt domain-containing protein [Ruminococcus sp.]MCM1393269.1 Hpt domain-containing protein [Ruminococcus sp.]MCM1485287.1 Hpt domain-containing protein [Faecalibacterium sp.]
MTLKECYEIFSGDYDGVVGRMRSEALVKKFIFKFENDPNYGILKSALDARNREEAFRAAHTIKGVCQNLGFTKLQESSSLLTQHLRVSLSDDCFALMNQVTEDYEKLISAISTFRNSGE